MLFKSDVEGKKMLVHIQYLLRFASYSCVLDLIIQSAFCNAWLQVKTEIILHLKNENA